MRRVRPCPRACPKLVIPWPPSRCRDLHRAEAQHRVRPAASSAMTRIPPNAPVRPWEDRCRSSSCCWPSDWWSPPSSWSRDADRLPSRASSMSTRASIPPPRRLLLHSAENDVPRRAISLKMAATASRRQFLKRPALAGGSPRPLARPRRKPRPRPRHRTSRCSRSPPTKRRSSPPPTTPSSRPTGCRPRAPIAAASPISTASLRAPGAMARGSIATARSCPRGPSTAISFR